MAKRKRLISSKRLGALLLLVACEAPPADPCLGRFELSATVYYSRNVEARVIERACVELTYTLELADGEMRFEVGEEEIAAEREPEDFE